MTSKSNFRFQRIEYLLNELKHEVTRGIEQGEIDEKLKFQFIAGMSRAVSKSYVFCEFRTFTRPYHEFDAVPKLRIIK